MPTPKTKTKLIDILFILFSLSLVGLLCCLNNKVLPQTASPMQVTTPQGQQQYYSTMNNILDIYKVNINTASKERLMELPDIGDTLALRIIEYREAHGDFKEIHEITNVNGIGEYTFSQIEVYISVCAYPS